MEEIEPDMDDIRTILDKLDGKRLEYVYARSRCSTIKEALKESPAHRNVILHLNPDDFAQYQDIQKEQASHSSEGIEFIADSAVGPAECILESPKGILKLSIEENLERIAKAFEKVE